MARRVRGPLIGLAIVGLFTFAVGYGGYRAIRHLMGWTVDAQAPSGPLRIEIEDAMLRRVDVSDSKVELTSDLLGMFGATLVVTPKTRIDVNGTPVQLKDLPQGARVRASYEYRDGLKVAFSISAEPPTADGPSRAITR
jgi:hypothetical protein